MATDDSNPNFETSDATPPSHFRPLPRAWQPLTWREVAAFSRARLSRLLVVQLLIALTAATAVLWFLDTGWFPVLTTAISHLPETGHIEDGRLISPRSSTGPLAETRLLSLAVDVTDTAAPGPGADFRVELRQRHVAICSLLGCLTLPYPKGWSMVLNRPDLESWWGAWEPMLYAIVGTAVVSSLLLVWWILATLYWPFLRLYAFFKDRDLTLAGSWNMAAASQMAPALLVSASIVFYGLGWIDLVHLAILWVLHFPISWVYLCLSSRRLPAASDAIPGVRHNPFDEEPSADFRKAPTANPFNPSGPDSKTGP